MDEWEVYLRQILETHPTNHASLTPDLVQIVANQNYTNNIEVAPRVTENSGDQNHGEINIESDLLHQLSENRRWELPERRNDNVLGSREYDLIQIREISNQPDIPRGGRQTDRTDHDPIQRIDDDGHQIREEQMPSSFPRFELTSNPSSERRSRFKSFFNRRSASSTPTGRRRTDPHPSRLQRIFRMFSAGT